MVKEKLHIHESLLLRMRVRWLINPHYGRGRIVAIYSDGTCDVQSDVGPFFKGWSLRGLYGEER